MAEPSSLAGMAESASTSVMLPYESMPSVIGTVAQLRVYASCTLADLELYLYAVRDHACDGWHEMENREHLNALCESMGYIHKVVAQEEEADPWIDLVLGTLIIATIISALFLKGVVANRVTAARMQRRALNRSLSCPALVELKSTRAIDACADMLLAFDTLDDSVARATKAASEARPKSPAPGIRLIPAVRSLETLKELDVENRWSFPRPLRPSATPATAPSPRPAHPPSSSTTVEEEEPGDSSAGDSQERAAPARIDRSQLSVGAKVGGGGHANADGGGGAGRGGGGGCSGSSEGGSMRVAGSSCGGRTCSGASSDESESGLSCRTSSGSSGGGAEGLSHGEGGGRTGRAALTVSTGGGGGAGSGAGSAGSETRAAHGIWGRVGRWSPRGRSPAAKATRREARPSPEWVRYAGGRPRQRPRQETMRTHLIVLGAPGVGKSTVISVLRSFAARHRVEIDISEGIPTSESARAEALVSAVPLIVWDAGQRTAHPLSEYVTQQTQHLARGLYTHAMAARGKGAPNGGGEPAAAMESRVEKMLLARKIVLCNKSDVQPCPLPEIAALEPGTLFLAGSAVRGTNMRELWRRVETCAARRH